VVLESVANSNDASDKDQNPSTDPINRIQEFQDKWSQAFTSDMPWQEFTDNCSSFAKDVVDMGNVTLSKHKAHGPRRPNRPSARPVVNNRRPLTYNPIEAKRLQTLYRLSKKRAARKVLNDNKPSFSGTVDEANDFFTRVFDKKTCDIDGINRGLEDFVPTGPINNNLGDHLTSVEVMNKLRKLSNSSPGADRVEYRHLRTVDPKCKILTTMFNRCLDENDVPADWKSSVTILIHKKGDASDVSNFRPIALIRVMYI
jgi:hypothetical protein